MKRWRRRVRAHWLAVRCAVALTVATVRIRTKAGKRLVGLLGDPQPSLAGETPVAELSAAELDTIRAARGVGHMVERVAGLLPWHPTCLRQALATRWLLRRCGIDSVLHLGVADVATMDAHAWVTVHGSKVVGRTARAFAPVASFPG